MRGEVNRVRNFCTTLGALVLLLAAPGFGDFPAPNLPGWPAQGLVLSGKVIRYSSPTIADIDGDPSNGLEVTVGGADGRIYVYRADGSLLWERTTPALGCATASSTERLYASPAVGALFGDGVPYVVAAYGSFRSGGCDGGVVAFRGSDGTRAFTFSTKKFARQMKFQERLHGVYSSPALADTDGDGRLEIAFGAFDRNVYLLEHNGSVRWYYNAADTVFSSPTFADVNGDGRLEVLIGTDISANPRLKPATKDGGFVYALKSEKRAVRRIRFRDSSAYLWQRYLPQVVFSSPVIADVLSSNPGPEVVIGSGCFFPQRSSAKRGRTIAVLRLTDGAILKKLATPACLPSSVAVGDLSGDGRNDIVALVQGSRSLGGPGESRLIAYNLEGSSVLWSVVPRVFGKNEIFSDVNSPVTVDLDGNGSLEVVVANSRGIAIHNGVDGRALHCTTRECFGPEPALLTRDPLRATPAIADMNLDGLPDIVIGGGHGGRGRLYSWTGFAALGSSPGGYPPFSAPWPMWRGAPSHVRVVE